MSHAPEPSDESAVPSFSGLHFLFIPSPQSIFHCVVQCDEPPRLISIDPTQVIRNDYTHMLATANNRLQLV